MKSKLKLGIAGSGGTGRTSLAAAVAKKLSIPFLEAKTITDPILMRDGFDYGSGIQIEKFLASGSRQEEILAQTIKQMESVESFVTDRTMVDLAAYAVCELHDHDPAMLQRIFDKCRKYANTYTHVFVCPWTAAVKDNQRRTLNPWYQLMIAGLDCAILMEWHIYHQFLTTKTVDDRVVEIVRQLE